MEDAIKNFHTQFVWKPIVANAERLRGSTSGKGREVEPRGYKKFILNGMGGSHLAADILAGYRPELDLFVFSDYGIPPLAPARLKDTLLIASSFSGNTEEALEFAEEARRKKLPLAAIAKGGKLLAFAKEHGIPYVELPPVSIQPRSGLGLQCLALAALIGDANLLKELAALADTLAPDTLEEKGKALAAALRGKVPVIYASTRNRAVAYNWKIKLNETGKMPAFYNVIPELNHNEMTGFDVIETTEGLSRKFHFIFLTDTADRPQNQKRMRITKKLYENRGLSCSEVPVTTPALADSGTPFVKGDSRLEKIFSSLLIADWTALHLSQLYGTEAEQVPMVEQFKKLITVTGNG